MPEFVVTDDARAELGPSGESQADDLHVYAKELHDAECLATSRLADMVCQERSVFNTPDDLELAIKHAEQVNDIVLEADQRRSPARCRSSAADPV